MRRAVSVVVPFLAIAAALLLGAILATGTAHSVRWTTYLLVVPPFFALLLLVRDPVLLLGVVFVPLFFVEQTLISFRSAGGLVYSAVSLPTFAVASLALWLHGHRPRIGSALLFAWGLLLLSVAVATSTMPSEPSVSARRYQLVFVEGFLYFAMGTAAWRSIEDFRRFGWVLVGVSVGLAALQFHFFRTGQVLLQPNFAIKGHAEGWRYGGPLLNPNTLADFHAVVVPVAILLAVAEERVWKRVLLVAALAMMAAGVVLTGSRGGTIATVAALALTGLALSGRLARRPGILVLLALGVAGAYVLAVLHFHDIWQQTALRWETRGLEDVRTQIWSTSLDIIVDHPLGLGMDPKLFLGELARRRPGLFFALPHNLWLGIAINGGIVAVLAFTAIVVAVLRRGVQAVLFEADRRARLLRLIPVLSVAVFLVAAFTEPIFDNGHKLNHLFWLLCGAMLWRPADRAAHAAAAHQPVARGVSSDGLVRAQPAARRLSHR